MVSYSFDYSICPYYLVYTMGCYQIVIEGDNNLHQYVFEFNFRHNYNLIGYHRFGNGRCRKY